MHEAADFEGVVIGLDDLAHRTAVYAFTNLEGIGISSLFVHAPPHVRVHAYELGADQKLTVARRWLGLFNQFEIGFLGKSHGACGQCDNTVYFGHVISPCVRTCLNSARRNVKDDPEGCPPKVWRGVCKALTPHGW